ncbi:MAG: hypothetical protein H6834_04915 [Planctomycetes bacterium]|nr:hypothetical protein [Planctomycetota bacterium]
MTDLVTPRRIANRATVQALLETLAPPLEHRKVVGRLLDDARLRLGRSPRSVLEVDRPQGTFVCRPPRITDEDLATDGTVTLRAHSDRLPFRDETFEVVCAQTTLEPASFTAARMREFARVTQRLVLISLTTTTTLSAHHTSLREAFERTASEAGLTVLRWDTGDVPSTWDRTFPGRLLPWRMRELVNGALVTTGLITRPRPAVVGVVLAKPSRM